MRARREGNKFRSMSGWRKIGCAGVVVTRLTSVKKLLTVKKICLRNELLTEFAYHKQIYCKQKYAYKICLLKIKFAYGDCLFYIETYQFSKT